MPSRETLRAGVDIGGTFTDIVLLGDRGSVHIKKLPSTPDDYARAIVVGLRELLDEIGASPADVESVIHATTVATNAVLEDKGARTGLITTKGFRDVLEIRRIRIPELYNLDYEKPKPLVARRWRREVVERMGANGEVRVPLDEASVIAAGEFLRDEEVEAVAIALLHSYANPAHEQRVAEIIRKIVRGDVYVSCSHEILPEIREYERTSTTVVNALLGPVVGQYLNSLADQLAGIGFRGQLQLMQSNGGLMGVRAAIAKPACILESGPAAGVVAAARIAGNAGVFDAITFDMGGTTAKASIIEGGMPAKTTEYEVGAGINLSSKLIQGAGYAVKLPVIDLSEIGAGGGSLVWFDKGGLLQVGPKSAGSVPGPVCYNGGGSQATLTDALLALGYINPGYLVGGALCLNAQGARDAIEEQVGQPLGRPLLEAAYGVFTIAAANMTRAVKAVSTYRGRDPRSFTLFAFGGNGPVVAFEIARQLGMKRILIPPSPGVFSAFGLLLSEVEHEVMQTLYGRVDAISAESLQQAYARIESQARSVLQQEGYAQETVSTSRYADLHYCHQAFELTIPVAGNGDDVPQLERLVADFHAEHLRTYGHRAANDPVELVNIRIIARVAARSRTTLAPERLIAPRGDSQHHPRQRTAFFGPEIGSVPVPVLTRRELLGKMLPGPLIIEEYDSTCVIAPGCHATVDAASNIDIRLGD